MLEVKLVSWEWLRSAIASAFLLPMVIGWMTLLLIATVYDLHFGCRNGCSHVRKATRDQ